MTTTSDDRRAAWMTTAGDLRRGDRIFMEAHRILVVTKATHGETSVIEGRWLGGTNLVAGHPCTVEWTTDPTTEVELA